MRTVDCNHVPHKNNFQLKYLYNIANVQLALNYRLIVQISSRDSFQILDIPAICT